MESKQSPESDRRRGESSLRASQWNDVLDCRWKLWVFAGDRVCERECVCVCAHVVNCGFLHPRLCVCVREGEPETVTVVEMHSDCGAAPHILMTLSFYWTINRWRSGENVLLAVLISDRSDLRPLHHPDPGYVWLPTHCTL